MMRLESSDELHERSWNTRRPLMRGMAVSAERDDTLDRRTARRHREAPPRRWAGRS